MGRSYHSTDAYGWTWTFRKHKDNIISKPIGNPFQKDLGKISSSFYVSNFPESTNAKELWNTFLLYGRLADAYIPNKRSKGGKRFGFIRFLGVTDATKFLMSLSNVWIRSFHLFITVAKFQRQKLNDTNPKPHESNFNHQTSNPSNPKTSPTFNDIPHGKPSFASVVHGASSSGNSYNPTKIRFIFLKDQDLVGIDDSSKVLLVKLKEVESMSTIVCIATKCHQIVSEEVQVEVNSDNFMAYVQDIGTWSINIFDDAIESHSTANEGEETKISNFEEGNSDDGIDDLINELNENKEHHDGIPDNISDSNKED
ncbi:RNA-directed DNA polymerase, eukaryota [Tanacetum coccineum]